MPFVICHPISQGVGHASLMRTDWIVRAGSKIRGLGAYSRHFREHLTVRNVARGQATLW
jgi:hypothetical protein